MHPVNSFAQTNAFSAANSYSITGGNIQEGMIISHNNGQFKPSIETYDKNIFGVVVFEPAVEFVRDPSADNYPVVRSGIVRVQVSGANGPIAVGDRITTSEAPGVGMKATKSGFSLGIAQSAFAGTTAEQTATILVGIDIQFTFAEDSPVSETISSRLLDIIKLNAIATLESPTTVMRYSLAVVTILGSLAVSFVTFSKTAQKGIEAIGRNPLAKDAISSSILLNVGISFIIISAGVLVAYFIVTW